MTASPISTIAHLDLDCFFVSVERVNNPSLCGKPVIVGGSPSGRGVVASASYEARAFGVRSAMPTVRALRLCPQAIVVRGRHGEYGIISDNLYRRMLAVSPTVERASIDEMYLDLTGCASLYHHSWETFARDLQKIVLDEFGLPCSVGIASNKLVAKIAVGAVKPAGVIIVPYGTEAGFLAPLAIEVIPGVGEKTSALLRKQGFAVVADLQVAGERRLEGLLGEHGKYLHMASLGQGSTQVTTEHVRKSIGREETFAQDIRDREELRRILFRLVEDVCQRVRIRGWKAGTVTLKLRYADFTTVTRQKTITPTNYDPEIFRAVRDLFDGSDDRSNAVRLLGVGLSRFVGEAGEEMTLFSEPGRRVDILDAVGKIRRKFGNDAIHIGGL